MTDKKTELQKELEKAGVLEKVKSIFLKLSTAPAAVANPETATPPASVALAANEIKLADGSSLIVEEDAITEGAKVKKVTPEGTTDLTDGDYPAMDGTIYTVTAGVITKITAVAAPEFPDMPAMMKDITNRITALEAKFSASEAENVSLKAKMSEQENTIKVAFTALNTIVTMPASAPLDPGTGTPKPDLSKVPYDQLKPFQKLKRNRGEL